MVPYRAILDSEPKEKSVISIPLWINLCVCVCPFKFCTQNHVTPPHLIPVPSLLFIWLTRVHQMVSKLKSPFVSSWLATEGEHLEVCQQQHPELILIIRTQENIPSVVGFFFFPFSYFCPLFLYSLEPVSTQNTGIQCGFAPYIQR